MDRRGERREGSHLPLEIDYSRWLRLSLLKGYGNVGWYDISTVQYGTVKSQEKGEMNGKAGGRTSVLLYCS